MSSEQNMLPATTPSVPEWIQPSLFESVYKELDDDFQQITSFKAIPALSAGENYATLMLRLEADIELKGMDD